MRWASPVGTWGSSPSLGSGGFLPLKDAQGFPWSFHLQRKSEAAGYGCPESRAGQDPGKGTPTAPGQWQPSRGRAAPGAPGIRWPGWRGVHCPLISQPACLLAFLQEVP